MKRIALLGLLFTAFIQPVWAAQIIAPEVTGESAKLIPDASSFGEGFWRILQDLIPLLRPDLAEAAAAVTALLAASMLIALLQCTGDTIKSTADLIGVTAVSATMLLSTRSMIQLASVTIQEMTEYGKLLLPVMTAAMAAQGRISTSGGLYAGTAIFSTVLNTLITRLLVPGIYLFLAASVAAGATGEESLKQLKELIKNASVWCLKTVLSLFSGYMGITGVISGTTDAAALKVTKAAISTVVPVVGGMLSDASETVLLSISTAKNAAGLYGIFAVLVIFLRPFLKIGCHYMLLKAAGAISGIFASKRVCDLISDFSAAMGLLLAMSAAVCLLLLISTVCFMKGVA